MCYNCLIAYVKKTTKKYLLYKCCGNYFKFSAANRNKNLIPIDDIHD